MCWGAECALKSVTFSKLHHKNYITFFTVQISLLHKIFHCQVLHICIIVKTTANLQIENKSEKWKNVHFSAKALNVAK